MHWIWQFEWDAPVQIGTLLKHFHWTAYAKRVQPNPMMADSRLRASITSGHFEHVKYSIQYAHHVCILNWLSAELVWRLSRSVEHHVLHDEPSQRTLWVLLALEETILHGPWWEPARNPPANLTFHWGQFFSGQLRQDSPAGRLCWGSPPIFSPQKFFGVIWKHANLLKCHSVGLRIGELDQ